MNLREALANPDLLLLDAAMGTEIRSRGMTTADPLWGTWCLLQKPQIVYDIHCDHLKAGARLITTNTFRTQAHVLEKTNQSERCEALTSLAVQLARKACQNFSNKAWVLGSMAPLEDCYQPQRAPSWTICRREHRRHARALAQAGVDGLILETFSHPQEIKAALTSAQETNLPVILSLICRKDDHTLEGTPLEKLVKQIENECRTPDVWGLNCLTPYEMTTVHRKLKKATQKPTAVWAHVGFEDHNSQWHEKGLVSAQAYGQITKLWLKDGAKIIGGCCGTDATFLKSIITV